MQSFGSVVDDFESGDLSAYQEGGQQPSDYVLTSSSTVSPRNGSVHLGYSATISNPTVLTSTSGLNAYPSAGDTFRVWVYADNFNGQGAGVYYGVPSESSGEADGYLAYIRSGRVYLEKNQRSTRLASGSGGVSTGTYYQLEVDWQTDGTHSVQVLNQQGSTVDSLTASDSEYGSSGVGTYVNSPAESVTAYWDYWRIA